MKKLMIAAAMVCAAAFTQAATYDWTMAGYATPNGVDGGALTGAKIYGFDANAYSFETIAGKLTDASIGADALSLALNYGEIDDGAYYEFGGSDLTDNALTKQPSDVLTASMYAIVVAKDGSGKDWFYQIAAEPVEITDGVIGGGALFEPGDGGVQNTGAIGGPGWTEVAPEPTSGLLLLIGVAGLALRRRRA